MFDYIGGKIKKLAYASFVIGMIGSVVGAIIIWAMSNRYTSTIFQGIMVLAGGCIVSWISAFFTYGFGELIENTQAMRSATEALLRVQKQESKLVDASSPSPVSSRPTNSSAKPLAAKISKDGTWSCKKCGMINSKNSLFCQSCGEYR